mgnify:FL=1
MSPLVNIGNIPFDINVLSSLFPGCRHITEKARALVDSGKIIRLKKGLYIASEQESGKPFNRFLISNHIYGPSYVSQSSALRHYGLIPERVHAVQAVTTKHSRDFETSIGFFRYTGCSDEYFHIGLKIMFERGVNFLIASSEKALCDLINFSKGVSLRFVKDVRTFLEDDIRFDTDALADLDIEIIRRCAQHSRRQNSIENLIKYIQYERDL